MVNQGTKYFNNSPEAGSIRCNETISLARKAEIMTDTGGDPIAGNQNSRTAGPRGWRACNLEIMPRPCSGAKKSEFPAGRG